MTPLIGNGTSSSFYIVRQDDTTQTTSTSYKLKINTSIGNVTIPQLGGTLNLNGRDSKVHIADYNISSATIVYSTAEILIQVSGGVAAATVVEGSSSDVHTQATNTSVLLNWSVSSERQIVRVGSVDVYLLGKPLP